MLFPNGDTELGPVKHFGFWRPGQEPGESTLSNRRNERSTRSRFPLGTVPLSVSELSGASWHRLSGASPRCPGSGVSGTSLSLGFASPAEDCGPPGGGRCGAVSSPEPPVTLSCRRIQAMVFGFRNVLPGLPAEPLCRLGGSASPRGGPSPSARSGGRTGLVLQVRLQERH